MYHLARALCAQGDAVGVLGRGRDDEGAEEYRRIGATVEEGPSGPAIERGPARRWLGRHPFDAETAGAIARLAAGVDVVVLTGAKMLQYASEAARAKRVVADIVDDPALEAARRRQVQPSREGWFGRLRSAMILPRHERGFLKKVSVTTFVSDQDCASFRSRHPGARAACVPNGVDVDYFRRPDGKGLEDPAVPRVVFTGSMSFEPNEDAARYLVEEIAPLVWRAVPQAGIVIAGADPSPGVQALAGPKVTVTGRVPDIRPYLWGATVVAVPMRMGTGIKNKLLEAWAAGAAVVATPLACQGVPAHDGENLLLGRTPRELADCIVRLVQDGELRGRVAACGRKTAEAEMTWSAMASRLRDEAMAGGGRTG